MERDADFPGFLGETFSLIGGTAVYVLVFVIVIGGLTATGTALELTDPDSNLLGMGFMIDLDRGLVAALFQVGVAVVTVLASYFYLAKALEFRGRLSPGGTRIWAYIGMTILSVLGMLVGLVLLIIPGIILGVRWAASAGFLIGGQTGVTDSLRESWHATNGHSWGILFAAVVLFIGFAVVGGAIGGIIVAIGSNLALVILSGLVEAVGSVLFLAFGIAVYVLVSGTGEEIADIFE